VSERLAQDSYLAARAGQWRREAGAQGWAAPGDTISGGDTKRKKLLNFVGKMVRKMLWVKWFKKVIGKL